MPLQYVLVRVARLVSTPSPTFGRTKPVETEITGSPILARVYRVSQTTVQRDEAQPGTATVDQMQRLSVLDPLCGVQVGDIAFLPRADGSYTRAKVIRIRYYADRIQYDLETGAEGSSPPPSSVIVNTAENSSNDVVNNLPPALLQNSAENASNEAVLLALSAAVTNTAENASNEVTD